MEPDDHGCAARGRTQGGLEPENIEGKENISLPGVNVGDYVEVEYLLAESARGAAQPGFVASAFYFQIANMPNNWTT